jgi:hypothetical protein
MWARALYLILSAMERSSATNLIFLDACRDNPLARNLAQSMGTKSVIVGQGLAKVGSGVGTLISFAMQPGAVAFDGADRNSPYTGALLRHLGTPGEDISRELIYVRRDVLKATDGKQVPWDSSSLTGEVVLRLLRVEISPAETPQAEQPILSNQAVELSYWESIRDATEPSFFEAYLREYPDGAFATLAKLKLETLAKRAELDQRSKSEHVAMASPSPEIGAGNEKVLKQSNASRFDGIWKLTRRATNPSCGWRALSDVLTIKEGRIIAGHFEGKVSRDGSVQITHRFIDHGRTEFNELRGKIKGSTGTGKFVHIGGSCAGTIEISRMR